MRNGFIDWVSTIGEDLSFAKKVSTDRTVMLIAIERESIRVELSSLKPGRVNTCHKPKLT